MYLNKCKVPCREYGDDTPNGVTDMIGFKLMTRAWH